MHIHVLGICGTFMGGLAAIAREAGHRVTGCDANVYPPMSEQLRALGIELIEGYDASQLALSPDLWVIGNAVSRGNPLMEALLDAGAAYVSGPQWLAENVLQGRQVIAVAGTHGKTTTTAMLAFILERAGLVPGFLIGGVAADFPVSARLGQGRFFVIEADEYDTAFFDKRSKFVHYRPRIAILNNLEFDHADIFADLAAIETQFHHLVRTVPASGWLIVNAASAPLERVLARGCWSRRSDILVTRGWHEDAVEESAEATGFDILEGSVHHGRLRLTAPGAHNRANAIAAIAAADKAGVKPVDAIEALQAFAGVRRRLELRGHRRGVSVYDDFAHHPTAIAATLTGMRDRIGESARILAVFEPRSNTMKLGTMASQLPQSLAQADLAYCYSADLGWDAAAALAPMGERARCFRDIDALVQAVSEAAREDDHVVVMSNGSFGGIHTRLLDALDGVGQPGLQGSTRPADLPFDGAARRASAPPRARLIYLHGFRSSPSSFKAQILERRMRERGRQSDFFCPQLPSSPAEAVNLVMREYAPGPSDTLVGSSLGGYYATWLAEHHGCRAVLLNPAVSAARDLAPQVGTHTLYHSDAPFIFEPAYVDELAALEVAAITQPQRYLLVAAKGDQVLDWREMVAHYPGAQQIVLEGSDHGLSDFEQIVGQVLAFARV